MIFGYFSCNAVGHHIIKISFNLKHIYYYLILVLLLIPFKKESNQAFKLYWGFTDLDMAKFYFS